MSIAVDRYRNVDSSFFMNGTEVTAVARMRILITCSMTGPVPTAPALLCQLGVAREERYAKLTGLVAQLRVSQWVSRSHAHWMEYPNPRGGAARSSSIGWSYLMANSRLVLFPDESQIQVNSVLASHRKAFHIFQESSRF